MHTLVYKKKKGENNNSNNNNKTRPAVKAEIFCEAMGSVRVLLSTLPLCLTMLFWKAGKTLQVPVGEGGFLLIARHKVIMKISFENQISVDHESQISLISIWISLSI